MALVICEDCKKEISTMAVSCPNCGRPNANAGIVTIEQTGKKWKNRGVFGASLMGIAIGYGGIVGKTGISSIFAVLPGIALFAIGLMVWFSSGIGKWYHHG